MGSDFFITAAPVEVEKQMSVSLFCPHEFRMKTLSLRY